jgi:RimJ/RimL family protein N-acetyltransferase
MSGHGPLAHASDEEIVGMIRMARRDEPDTMETGMWLGRSYRGMGIGRAALQLLLAEAAENGIRRVVAETTFSEQRGSRGAATLWGRVG